MNMNVGRREAGAAQYRRQLDDPVRDRFTTVLNSALKSAGHQETAPAGMAEISVLFNRTVLHAGYDRDGAADGSPLKQRKPACPIGVRYLI